MLSLSTTTHVSDIPLSSYRRSILGVSLIVSILLASGCSTREHTPEKIDSMRERVEADLRKCVVILNGREPKKMHPKMTIEGPNTDGNFVFSFPELKHITADRVLVDPRGDILTKEIKIDIENIIFAIVARQRHGIEDGDTYTIRRDGYTISINKKIESPN